MIEYEFYKSPNPNEEVTSFHPRVICKRSIGIKELSREIEHGTSLTAADVQATSVALIDYIVMHLKKGERIHIDGLGFFQISLKGPKNAVPRSVRAESIKFKSLNFEAEKQLKKSFNNIELKHRKVRQSDNLGKTELHIKLFRYFRTHHNISRAKMQSLCSLTKITATRRINAFIAEHILENEGTKHTPVYVPGKNMNDPNILKLMELEGAEETAKQFDAPKR
ncbi:MAG: HU family DNA-binding protein [Phocaeicola sp.]|uniref:HU family DNA-binding protein n=1 Tax=Phocaeicola sp. TaxID=2773926 RepID=UPI003F9FC21F